MIFGDHTKSFSKSLFIVMFSYIKFEYGKIVFG